MLSPLHRQSLDENGFCRIEAMYDAGFLAALGAQAEKLVQRTYNQEQLDRHAVYPSDAGDQRISHAVMLAEGASRFPKVDHADLPAVSQFLTDYNALLADVTDMEVSPGSRCMLNYQNYFSGSKPVGEHFDGEYLRTERADDGVEFTLLEGILPRYVSVLIISNENDGKGTELVDKQAGKEFAPKLYPGDLVFFDNIRLRHRVPSMEQPRNTIGMRNFDHMPVHFVRSEADFLGQHYRPIAEGWVSEDVDCEARLSRFMADEWPTLKQEYSHYF